MNEAYPPMARASNRLYLDLAHLIPAEGVVIETDRSSESESITSALPSEGRRYASLYLYR